MRVVRVTVMVLGLAIIAAPGRALSPGDTMPIPIESSVHGCLRNEVRGLARNTPMRIAASLCLATIGVTAMGWPGVAWAEGACEPVSHITFSTPPQFTTQSYTFPSGGIVLSGCLYRPIGATSFPVIVEVSGSDDTPTASGIYDVIHAKALTTKGVGYFSYNKRGIGGSGGTLTDTNFAERATDVANAVAFARSLPGTKGVALLGFSQAGWVIPLALRANDGVEFVVMTSPSGVNAYEQTAYFVRNVMLGLGASPADAAKAETTHLTVVKYYATGRGYRAAQDLVNRFTSEAWFEKFRTNDAWNERIGPGGRLLTPAELKRAWVERVDDFRLYRAASTFTNCEPIYARLDRKTLIIEGTGDTTVPVEESEAVLRRVFAKNGNRNVEFKLFDGAEHGIQDGPRVRAAYLDFLGDWIVKAFKDGQR